MSDLKPCPFCGSGDIYETYSQEYQFGTKNPEIFCNSCKAIFSIEDDSPYMNCDEDFAYRKEKTREAWNRRKEDGTALSAVEVTRVVGDAPTVGAVPKATIPYSLDSFNKSVPSIELMESCNRARSLFGGERHGRWVKLPIGWKCSCCGEAIVINVEIDGKYCPHCGATMDEEEDEQL